MPGRKKQHLRLMVLALVCLGGAPMSGGLGNAEAAPTISNNTLSLNVPDKAIILKLTPSY